MERIQTHSVQFQWGCLDHLAFQMFLAAVHESHVICTAVQKTPKESWDRGREKETWLSNPVIRVLALRKEEKGI